jgi:hypothetical protein
MRLSNLSHQKTLGLKANTNCALHRLKSMLKIYLTYNLKEGAALPSGPEGPGFRAVT